MKSKRLLAILLAFLCVFSCLSPLTTYAASYAEKEITIYFEGTKTTDVVLVDAKGTKYIPLDWMTYYGVLECEETDSRYEYYYAGEEELSNYSRRVYINKNDKSFSVEVYCPRQMTASGFLRWLQKLSGEQKKKLKQKQVTNYQDALNVLGIEEDDYVTLDKGTFSKKVSYGGKTWVPMQELLPLMNVQSEVENGCLFMSMNSISIWQILYKYDMEDVMFDLDEELMFHEGLSATAYVVDTVLNLNIYRANILLLNTGKKKIIKKYLKIIW